jgi:hypothetical protein
MLSLIFFLVEFVLGLMLLYMTWITWQERKIPSALRSNLEFTAHFAFALVAFQLLRWGI